MLQFSWLKWHYTSRHGHWFCDILDDFAKIRVDLYTKQTNCVYYLYLRVIYCSFEINKMEKKSENQIPSVVALLVKID